MKLPAFVYSILGPVPVRLLKGLVKEHEMFGVWRGVEREIAIDKDIVLAKKLATLGHEMHHVAMTDSGVDEMFTERQAEAAANAFGIYFAAAVMSGYIKLNVPRKS